MNEVIELNGLRFRVALESDSDMGPPWKEHDGHGIVSDWTTRDKRAGERVLNADRGSFRYYDEAGTLELARRDGWGLGDEARAALAGKLGREPTAREITAEAVRADYEHMRAWCNDEWYWIGVVVHLLDVDGNDTDENDSLWGIESDAGDYLDEIAHDLATQIADRIGNASVLTRTTRIRKAA